MFIPNNLYILAWTRIQDQQTNESDAQGTEHYAKKKCSQCVIQCGLDESTALDHGERSKELWYGGGSEPGNKRMNKVQKKLKSDSGTEGKRGGFSAISQ